MRIQNNPTTQNFNAHPVCKTIIERKIPFTPFYRKTEAMFVQLDKKQDISSLTQFAASHPRAALTTDCVFDLRSDPHTNAFAITTQKEDFEELLPEKILGLCDGQFIHRGEKPVFYVQNLETQSANNPKAQHQPKTINFMGIELNYEEKYKNIGRKMLRELTRVLNHCDADAIELKPTPIKQTSFYERLGFKQSRYDATTLEVPRCDFDEFIERN